MTQNSRGASAESLEWARAAALAIDDKRGLDVVVIDVADIVQITEVFVIATGTSRRHAITLADAAKERIRDEYGHQPLRSEGDDEGEWILLDFGSMVVHVFQEETRRFYDLERLWADAERIEIDLPGMQ